jgi:Acetyltransferase (GNAT) domain
LAVLETERLRLRAWQASDREAFAQINADPRVMELFPKRLNRQESDAMVDRIESHFRAKGFGLYAAELRDDADSSDTSAFTRRRLKLGLRLVSRSAGGWRARRGGEVLRPQVLPWSLDMPLKI